MVNSTPSHSQIVIDILGSLAKIRLEQRAWIDSESEELGRETQIFKIGECLYPFYLASKEGIVSEPPLQAAAMVEDTRTFFKFLARDGFFPSPYSQIPDAVDQYTDLAAFALIFSTLVYDYWQQDSKRGRSLVNSAKSAAARALKFLLKPEHYLRDDEGCRWAGTSKCTRKVRRGLQEFYTSTFFTAIVASALARTLEHPALELPSSERDNVRNFIRDAGKWVVGRFDSEFITGDESRSNRALIYTTWGLRMLLETHGVQEEPVKKMLAPITNAYLATLKAKIRGSGSLVQQEYLTVMSEEVNTPLYYEDRSGVGGILTTLALLSRQTEVDDILDKIGFPLILEQTLNSVMSLRSPSTGLWYTQGTILSIHAYLCEAFLTLGKRGTEAGRKILISGHMVRTAIRETFSDDAIIAAFEQGAYQRLLRLVESSRQEQVVEAGMAQLASGGESDIVSNQEPEDKDMTRGKQKHRNVNVKNKQKIGRKLN